MIVRLNEITKAVEQLFNDNLGDYVIERNAMRNEDPNKAATRKGWIGIYRNSADYIPRVIAAGTARRWAYDVQLLVEIQAVSMHSGADVEDKLQTAETDVITLLSANPKLSNTVTQTTGYSIRYEFNDTSQIWFHSALVTVTCEIR